MYTYRARVVRWIDGDTVILDVDLGFYLRSQQSFRLVGIDAPERSKADPGPYQRALAYCEELAPAGSEIRCETLKGDKYGRWLAVILVPIKSDVGTTYMSLNMKLVSEGLAKALR